VSRRRVSFFFFFALAHRTLLPVSGPVDGNAAERTGREVGHVDVHVRETRGHVQPRRPRVRVLRRHHHTQRPRPRSRHNHYPHADRGRHGQQVQPSRRPVQVGDEVGRHQDQSR